MDRSLRSLLLATIVALPNDIAAQAAPPDGPKRTMVPVIACYSVDNLGMTEEGMTDTQLASIGCRKLPPGTVILTSSDHRKILGGVAVRARKDFPDRIDLFWIMEDGLGPVPPICKPPYLEPC